MKAHPGYPSSGWSPTREGRSPSGSPSGGLVNLYLQEGLYGRSEKHGREAKRKLQLVGALGIEREVESFSRSDVDRFIEAACCDNGYRTMATARAMCSAARPISSSVVNLPSPKRSAPSMTGSDRPSARSTCEGPSAPEEHAELVESAT